MSLNEIRFVVSLFNYLFNQDYCQDLVQPFALFYPVIMPIAYRFNKINIYSILSGIERF